MGSLAFQGRALCWDLNGSSPFWESTGPGPTGTPWALLGETLMGSLDRALIGPGEP